MVDFCLDLLIATETLGMTIVARMPTIAITISSSMSVKPLELIFNLNSFVLTLAFFLNTVWDEKQRKNMAQQMFLTF